MLKYLIGSFDAFPTFSPIPAPLTTALHFRPFVGSSVAMAFPLGSEAMPEEGAGRRRPNASRSPFIPNRPGDTPCGTLCAAKSGRFGDKACGTVGPEVVGCGQRISGRPGVPAAMSPVTLCHENSRDFAAQSVPQGVSPGH